MGKIQALLDHYGHSPLVLRDGSIHKISMADLQHADDPCWSVKLILYPCTSDLCPGRLEEAVGFIDGLKEQHIDYSGLIEQGYAISVYDLEEDPYKSLSR